MADLGSLNISGPAYIAMKSKADGWLESGENISTNLGLPLVPDDDASGPPKIDHYGTTRAINLKVEREYGGIGSSGGPVVSGRSDHADFVVEQGANKCSSRIFQHCCSGEQFAWVHMILLGQSLDLDTNSNVTDPSQRLHIRLSDANISSFEFNGGRYFGDEFASFTGKNLMESTSVVRGGKLLSVTHVVQYAFWYTGVSFEYGGVERGWDTGADEVWRNTPPPTP